MGVRQCELPAWQYAIANSVFICFKAGKIPKYSFLSVFALPELCSPESCVM